MNSDLKGSTRFNYRAKRKKTNLILNSLIVIVLVLIGFVAYSIFFAGNDKASPQKAAQTSNKIESAAKVKKDTGSNTSADANNNDTGNSSINEQNSNDTMTQDNTSVSSTADSGQGTDSSQTNDSSQGTDSSQVQTVQSPNSNNGNTVQDPNAANTAQTGKPHATDYNSSSADWKGMLGAMSSATGINQNNMTVWFLGSDKGTANGSVGTVSAKDNKQKYRVYLQYVDGQGWKTSKVEQVSQ